MNNQSAYDLILGRINSLLTWTGDRKFTAPPIKEKIFKSFGVVPDEDWERSMKILSEIKK